MVYGYHRTSITGRKSKILGSCDGISKEGIKWYTVIIEQARKSNTWIVV